MEQNNNLADLRRRAVTFADRAALGLSRARASASRNSKRRAVDAAYEATCLVVEAERLAGDVAEMLSGVSSFFQGYPGLLTSWTLPSQAVTKTSRSHLACRSDSVGTPTAPLMR